MSNPQSVDLDRVEQLANAVIESVEQLKISIETSSTRLNAAILREQTLGTATPESCRLAQANCIKANAKVILALYKYRHPQDCSTPTIIIADQNDHVCARVVRTYYDKSLAKLEWSRLLRARAAPQSLRHWRAFTNCRGLGLGAP